MRFFTIYTNIYIIEQLTVKKRTTLRCDNLQKTNCDLYNSTFIYNSTTISFILSIAIITFHLNSHPQKVVKRFISLAIPIDKRFGFHKDFISKLES